MNPLVSVVIPAYNAGKYIRETIDSIIGQTYKEIEVIIVDDGSTDSTYEICVEYSAKYPNVKLLNHKNRINKGVSISRKYAVDHAQGDFIAFCDSDDIMQPNKIESQLEAFRRHKGAVLVHSGMSMFGPDREFCEKFEESMTYARGESRYNLLHSDHWLTKNKILNSTVMVRSEYIKRIDFAFKQVFQYEDWALWILLGQRGDFVFIPDKLTRYRCHDTSATSRVISNELVRWYSFLELYFVLFKKLSLPRFFERLEIVARITLVLYKIFTLYPRHSWPDERLIG